MKVPGDTSDRRMDEIEAFRTARPAAPAYGPRARDAARARLLAAASGDEPGIRRGRGVAGTPLDRAVARFGWRLAMAGGLSIALAAAVAVAVTGRSPLDDGPAGPGVRYVPAPPVREVNAVEFLSAAARSVEARTEVPRPGPYQWRFTKTLERQPDGSTQTSENWIRCDGRKMVMELDGRKEVVNTEWPPDPDEYSPLQYYEKLRTLPTDPARLLAHIHGDRKWLPDPVEEEGEENPDDRAFRVISVYLSRGAGMMPPKLEAAIYRALAKMPGVKVEQGVVDTVGRVGIGISRRPKISPRERTYIVLESGTYRYLGHGDVPLSGKAPAGEPRQVDLRARGIFASAQREAKIVDKPLQH